MLTVSGSLIASTGMGHYMFEPNRLSKFLLKSPSLSHRGHVWWILSTLAAHRSALSLSEFEPYAEKSTRGWHRMGVPSQRQSSCMRMGGTVRIA